MNKQQWPYPRIIAHRGGGSFAPENTLAAIDVGAQYGFKMVELDAKLSDDMQIFLLHDDTLDRTSNACGIAGEMPWDKLSHLDAGSWFSSDFQGEKLARLDMVMARCYHHRMMANIEIKPTNGMDRTTGHAVAEVAARLWQGQTSPLLSSFSFGALKAAMDAAPDLPRGLLIYEWDSQWLEKTTVLACVSIHFNHKLLTKARVKEIKDAGLRVLAYTVNDLERARILMKWGTDAIFTDRIDLIGPNFNCY